MKSRVREKEYKVGNGGTKSKNHIKIILMSYVDVFIGLKRDDHFFCASSIQ